MKRLQSVVQRGLHRVGQVVSRSTKPTKHSPALGISAELTRSKPQLIAENLLLRQHLIVLNRSFNRPRFRSTNRALFVLLAGKVQRWKELLLIVKPETILRLHRQGFQAFWKRTSRARSREPKLPTEAITLIREMAASNRLWGAERIQGELLKVGIKVA